MSDRVRDWGIGTEGFPPVERVDPSGRRCRALGHLAERWGHWRRCHDCGALVDVEQLVLDEDRDGVVVTVPTGGRL